MNGIKPRTLLIVCPAYASHLNPLLAVAEAWQAAVGPVVIATGSVLAPLVEAAGCGFKELVLGPGNNPGVMRPDQQPAGEEQHMREFFEATERGPIAALEYQSRARRHDMLFEPKQIFRRLRTILAEVQPHRIMVDQLSYGATLALRALDRSFASFLPSAPTSLPREGELFGLPRVFPSCVEIDPVEYDSLATLCHTTDREFTAAFNQELRSLNQSAAPVESAFRYASPSLTMINYPEALLGNDRQSWSDSVHFLGSCLRSEPQDPEFEVQSARLLPGLATVYLSFGTFLSSREDALRRVVDALRLLPVNVIFAYGSAGAIAAGVPEHWIVRSTVPQLCALQHAHLAISHGGNNTVTEALTLGVPLLIGPFSSDQFDGAAAIEASGYGEAFSPNDCAPADLAVQIERLLANRSLAARLQALGRVIRRTPGPSRAVGLLLDQQVALPAPLDLALGSAR